MTLLRPTPRTTPDDWARANRVYKPSAGIPGPRDPSRTPYMVPFAQAFDAAHQLETYGQRYDAVIGVTSSQSGKTDTVLDIIGWTLDQRPAPILYVGPTKEFLNKEISPRLSEMLLGTRRLADKLARGKRETIFRKVLGGVPVVLAWAGSAASFAAMAAKIALVDELDRMGSSVEGEGDPFALLEARGFSFRDRIRGAISTPLTGTVDTVRDEASGLEFWRQMDTEDVQSKIWRLWQAGTRHHYCWPCPHCAEFFVPRWKQLRWPEAATPAEARRSAYIECPRCGGIIEERHKADMNARGVYVAPGQTVDADGIVTGSPPESTTLSFWASGLCSPFVTFGERAASYVTAKATGEQDKIQAVVNTGFGECYAPGGGDVPEWEEVAACRHPYKRLEVPSGVRLLTMAVDVQKNRLVYTVRGWGHAGTSWLVDFGELYGETTELKVWNDLALLLKRPIDGHVVRRAFIDSGFRPGKPINLPVNRVYEFCRRFPRLAFPTKGRASQTMPVVLQRIEVTARGSTKKYGLDLYFLDSDWCKSWVHERIRWDEQQPGAWYLPEDAGEGFCKQIVSEARVRKPNGLPVWVQRSRENHFLDCEGLQAALAHSLNVHLISAPEPESVAQETVADTEGQDRTPPAPTRPAKPSRSAAPAAKPSPASVPSAPPPKPLAAKPMPAASAREQRRERIAALRQRIYGGGR